MELSAKLLALYNEHHNDVNVPAHAIVSFRNFLNQSFKLGIRAGSRSITQVAQTNNEPKDLTRVWNGLPLDQQPGFSDGTPQKKTNELSTPSAQPVSTEEVKATDEKELTEKQIESEIKKHGGTFHHKAGLEAKKKILANILSSEQLPS